MDLLKKKFKFLAIGFVFLAGCGGAEAPPEPKPVAGFPLSVNCIIQDSYGGAGRPCESKTVEYIKDALEFWNGKAEEDYNLEQLYYYDATNPSPDNMVVVASRSVAGGGYPGYENSKARILTNLDIDDQFDQDKIIDAFVGFYGSFTMKQLLQNDESN